MKPSPPYRNVVGLSQAKLDELLKNFEKLKDFGGDLFDRVVRYVLDGEDEAVLGELGGKTDAAHALQLLCSTQTSHFHNTTPWRTFLQTIESIDCSFYMRLGKVFEAAAKSLPPTRFFCKSLFEKSRWLELLLQEASYTSPGVISPSQRTAITGSLIENMLNADGQSIEPFLVGGFEDAVPRYDQRARNLVLAVDQIGTTFVGHRDLVSRFLREGPLTSRQIAVENVARSKASVAVFIEELVDCATGSSKVLRESAEPLVRSEPETARPLLEKAAADPKAARREQAVRLLGRIYGDDSRALLEELLASEKSAAVKEAIANALRELLSAPVVSLTLAKPAAAEPMDLHPTVTPSIRARLDSLFAEYNAFAAEHNERFNSRQQKYFYPNHELPLIGPEVVERVHYLLERGGEVRGYLGKTLGLATKLLEGKQSSLQALLAHPEFQLIHLVRLQAMFRDHRQDGRHFSIGWGADWKFEAFRRNHTPRLTLACLAQALLDVGIDDETLVAHVMTSYPRFFRWEHDALWPFLWKNADVIVRMCHQPGGSSTAHWDNALRLFTTFPSIPPALIAKVWETSIGSVKTNRLLAQQVAVKLTDFSDRLLQALSARGSETRTVAAEWVGRLGDRQYIAPLHKAAKAEKIDAALDEMLTALERLGDDIEPYLDRDKLLADAQKNLKKGTPPALEWFPWARLPKVHWQDSGEAVPAEIVTWLLVQNFKLKAPDAGPLLRRYCQMMRPAERAELGKFVLGAWLDRDLKRKHTDFEARVQAKQKAAQQWQQQQQWIQNYTQRSQAVPAFLQQTQQQLEESWFQSYQREVGSAVAEKGILAVAGACCDASAVGPVQKYLKDWYGYRLAQCKALIAMLSSIEHPSATQFLLSIANRFRTKGIREEAEKFVNALAERKGWTLDELADRTLPTAGFDDDGTLELSFGPRQFRLRITPSLEAVLTDADGKTLKALPTPRKDDDEEQAKAAKKAFSAAKAELKKFAGTQTTRLYEAMCTERTWTVADWQTYLMGHPLMKFLCQRLVWAVELPSPAASLPKGDGSYLTFRPLDDGTFTDYEDNEVQIPASASIRVAHSCHISADTAAAWTTHLADYCVAPLFTQFGRTSFVLPEDKQKETAIDDFCGHMVEAFKLRSLATKFGYVRGQAQDGGWFYDYIKSFPGLGLKVVLNFSGNGLPEENRTVALKDIVFQKAAEEESSMMQMPGGMALDEVPAVLLSECYNDLRTLAASGPGFDADWEKKVY